MRRWCAQGGPQPSTATAKTDDETLVDVPYNCSACHGNWSVDVPLVVPSPGCGSIQAAIDCAPDGHQLTDGRLSIPSEVENPFRVRWQPPRFRWINRAAQVDADIRYLQLGALSLDDVASQFGDTARNIMRQKARNIDQAKELATEFGLEDWRELFNPYQTFANANFVELLAQSQPNLRFWISGEGVASSSNFATNQSTVRNDPIISSSRHV